MLNCFFQTKMHSAHIPLCHVVFFFFFVPTSTSKNSTMKHLWTSTGVFQMRTSSLSCTPSLCPSLLLAGWLAPCWWAGWWPAMEGRYARRFCSHLLFERVFVQDGRVSAQERDSGESYCAGVYWGRADGLQQGLQDACHGRHWTLHHGGALRWARLVPGGINVSHWISIPVFFFLTSKKDKQWYIFFLSA